VGWIVLLVDVIKVFVNYFAITVFF
jgi:hypothetical protein